MISKWLGRLSLLLAFISGSHAADEDAILVLVGDQHSAYSRTAQLVAHVDRLIAENPGTPVGVLINGDIFEHGNVVARRSEGAIDLAMLTALARRAPTVVNLGNHEPEFHDVPTTLDRLRATGVTVVGNLVERGTGQLFAPASVRLALGKTELVIVGVTTDILAQYRAAVRPQLELFAPETWARERFPELLAGEHAKVVMSHAGLRLDRGMLPFIPDGTLIAGAHDHAQFVAHVGRTAYVHSGSWNSHISVARLTHSPQGSTWAVEQRPITDEDPADAALAALVERLESQHLNAEDLHPVGLAKKALPRVEAAQHVVRALQRAAEVDAAFIGNTTFGDGLPAGSVSRYAFDACVRFDGTIWVAEVSGQQLAVWLRAANPRAETPLEERQGEFQFAAGPSSIDMARTYRVATNDWGVRNRDRYFGSLDIAFTERPELRLKSIAMEALSRGEFRSE
jgi:5'-nucleotidase/UDP-sugar diphosphatase